MKPLEELRSIDVTQIIDIEMTSIGILDTFGKLVIQIYKDDNTRTEITFLSPVPIKEISKWLEDNKLLDITTLMKY